MILKSFQILAICTSMAVTPSNFHYEQMKRANDNTAYSHDINGTRTAEDTRKHATMQMWQCTTKEYRTDTFNEFMLITEAIFQNTYEINPVSTTINKQITDYYTPSELLKIQLTPYKNLVNNTVTLRTRTNLRAFTGSTNQDIDLNISTYICQDDRWQTYIDQTTYSNWNNNLNIIRDIENSQNGFIYTKQTYTQEIRLNESAQQTNYNTEITVPIDPNKNNYIFVFTYITMHEDEGQSTGQIMQFNNASEPYVINNINQRLYTISGEYINANINYEVIDVPGVMFEVLTMPFSFISIAFNLTLFPNTPYQINISNLFLSIIGFLVFILIIKKLTGH